MKKVLIIAILVLFVLGATLTSQAGSPSRVRFLVHGSKKLDSVLEIKTHFIPAGNLLGELKPLCYSGVAIWPWKKVVYFEPLLGWNFATDEPILALMYSATIPIPNLGAVWSWWDFEYQTRTKDGYIFAQMEFQPCDWFNAGMEMELWGNWQRGPWNVGMGPNILLRYGTVGLDIAGQYRAHDDVADWELAVRLHLFY